MKNHECIHCRKCTQNCAFLQKYNLDIGGQERLNELAYHCFLCGTCSQVCPQGIDGRGVILKMRQQQVRECKGLPDTKGYAMIMGEKEHYLFRNYRHISSGTVLFPGCNFPSFYPVSNRKLWQLLNRYQTVGMVYDCCGKPIAELGKEEQAGKIIDKINHRLQAAGVSEVIMICPNCYYYLRSHLTVKVVSIYEKLQEWGLGYNLEEGMNVFIPCPDKGSREWLGHMEAFLPPDYTVLEDVQCCGLGGCAAVKEPELAKAFPERLKQADYSNVYTYCGTCGGNLTRAGVREVRHILAEIIGSREEADTRRSLLNRAVNRLK